MISSWYQFLKNLGARFDNSRLVDFGDELAEAKAARLGNVIADLSHLGVIETAGDDATDFLHRLLTSDIKDMQTDQATFAAWCSPKGRVLALFLLVKHEERYYLLLPADLLDQTLQRLRMYVLRAKVALNDVSDAVLRIGLSGPDLPTLMGSSLPNATDSTSCADDLLCVRAPGPHPRIIILGESNAVQSYWESLQSKVQPVGSGAWRLLDILSGLSTITSETADRFLPQMLNLQALGGVSFSKGCYPGQEIIARLKYRGQLKRRTFLALIDTANTPPMPSEVFAGGDPIGEVLSAARYAPGTIALLAVLPLDAQSLDLRLGAIGGPSLQLQPLPYSLADE